MQCKLSYIIDMNDFSIFIVKISWKWSEPCRFSTNIAWLVFILIWGNFEIHFKCSFKWIWINYRFEFGHEKKKSGHSNKMTYAQYNLSIKCKINELLIVLLKVKGWWVESLNVEVHAIKYYILVIITIIVDTQKPTGHRLTLRWHLIVRSNRFGKQ